jgi:hypothetical protein
MSLIVHTVLAAVVLSVLAAVVFFVVRPLTSPLRALPGPPVGSGLFAGHVTTFGDPKNTPRNHEESVTKYGKSFRVLGLGKVRNILLTIWKASKHLPPQTDERLLTLDPLSISYILNRASESYPKPWLSRTIMSNMLGLGVFVLEGES